MAIIVNNQKLGEAIRTLRRRRGLTQEEVAQVIGVKRPAYTAWENNKSKPSINAISKLANLYDVEIEDFIHFGTTLSEDQPSITDKMWAAAIQPILANDSPDNHEAHKMKQVIALMEHNLEHIVLLAYGDKLDDVMIQKQVIYTIAAAKDEAITRIQRKINAITANAGNNGP